MYKIVIKKLFTKFLMAVLAANFLLPFFVPNAVQAAGATLFLSPATGTYKVGGTFTVKMMVNSGGGVGVNAAEGVIKYDPSLITVTGLSDSGSIFKLWTTEPTYSNTAGTITFGGGSPGAYIGNSGLIFSITFSAKKVGTADATIAGGIVLAADGKGTNVFSGYGQGKYVIEEKKQEEVEKPKPIETTEKPKDEPKGLLPPLPDVNSPSHPDSNVWSRNNEPEFDWKILSDLTSVSYSINEKAESDPGPNPDGIIEQKKFDPIKDGEWYFHIKFQNRYGWGKVASRKFMVDATAPESFNIIVDNEGDNTNPTPKLRFKTKDLMSGLDYFDVVIDGQKTKTNIEEVSGGFYQPKPLAPGEHMIAIIATDKAANSASSSVEYIVEPLRAPIISDIPKVLSKKEQLIIRGTSFYPNISVVINIKKSDKDDIFRETISTDENGNWSYFHKPEMEKGSYEVWASLIDGRGAQSLDSSKYILTVVSPSIIEAYGLFIILLLLLIIIGLVTYIFYVREKHLLEKRRIKQETEEMKRKLSKIFAALREEVDELIELADKRPGLSESERRVKEKLQESLDISEEFIGKEVEDVEKEIKLP
jgi:hypothetical protein